MAGSKRTKAERGKAVKRGGGWKRLLAVALLLATMTGGVLAWWKGQHWVPPEAEFPDQGALVGAADGPVDFGILKGIGAKFVYLEASIGGQDRDRDFTANLARARAAGLQVGAVHIFDPCVLAGAQSGNFVTVVPRDRALLPPVIALRDTGADCAEPVSEAAIASELMTLVNQIEMHEGKPVILAPSEEFEEAHGIAVRIGRNLWLTRSWFEPHYAGRSWLMWTANRALYTEASASPLRWVVVHP